MFIPVRGIFVLFISIAFLNYPSLTGIKKLTNKICWLTNITSHMLASFKLTLERSWMQYFAAGLRLGPGKEQGV
jgi:hypothetical protein